MKFLFFFESSVMRGKDKDESTVLLIKQQKVSAFDFFMTVLPKMHNEPKKAGAMKKPSKLW